ncbi:winged helix-turn-helix domain-containing protein [Candidatus Woesearchaeota archaeon]|nr:winged helix-turn-helix domain-containing protein [Candidatus Woesearchaeota archaeon]
MVSVKKEGVILEATDLEFENQAVLNPACIKDKNNVHMFYRAVGKDFRSCVGYCKLDGPLKVAQRSQKPILFPENDYEKQGVEDPRIVCIDETYYMLYTAYDGKNALIAYAVSKDLIKWEKKGVISPKIKYNDVREIFLNSKLKDRYFFFKSFYKEVKGEDVLLWEKDAILFPKKINGKFALIHRILPDIQVIYFDDFKQLADMDYWKRYLETLPNYIILEPKYWYESRNIGGGCPPIETEKGWIFIYHAVQNAENYRVYHAAAALLDKANPTKIRGRLEKPLFSPELDWELQGDVNNVVFPEGAAIFDDRLYIYYGAADKRIGVASVSTAELLNELLPGQVTYQMNYEIGKIAGEIYRMCKDTPRNLSEIRNTLKRKEDLIYLAIGWLSRENKIEFLSSQGDMKIKTK